MYRRTVLLVLVATAVVLAGCTGGGSSPGTTTAAPTTNGQPTTTTGGGSGNGGTDSGSGGGGAEFAFWNFTRPGTYTYDIYEESQGKGTLVWDVQKVDGDQVTVHVKYDLGDTSYESTVSGDEQTVQGQLMMTPAGGFLLATMFSPSMAYYQDHKLAVGNSWSFSSDAGSLSFAVTGKDTYGGIECYASEMRVNGTVVNEGCFSPDHGLAPYVAYYDDQGDPQFTLTLKSYQPK